ncbi:hypothetical protein R1sor_010985 [Riccia sorocarpa]|uniref:phosphoglycerate mutase (2,3-diphosphoglycerate-dependent) n=1 Tax=Riccia sorocarpa TaxID=122646 RepID=A0ABD3I1F8_9MARC
MAASTCVSPGVGTWTSSSKTGQPRGLSDYSRLASVSVPFKRGSLVFSSSLAPSTQKCSRTHLSFHASTSGSSNGASSDAHGVTATDAPSAPSTEAALILIRHGESLWNQKNLFTGCVDVPLSQQGVVEALEAGKRICDIPVDIIYTSALIRAQMTAMLAMTQHRKKKVPTVLHTESDRAIEWSKIFSEATKEETIPVLTAWELNERMYGELQGLNKKETADKFGPEQVKIWRRSYDVPPPNGESLAMCAERAVKYFSEQVEPQLAAGKNVLISAHGNSLRSIIMYLDKLTSQEVIELELSTGIPMLYVFKRGKFIRRGSPTGPTVQGVYALTRSLAAYRDQLDKAILE